MDETLIENWNRKVHEEDDVYIIGDFSYRADSSASTYLQRLNGKKHLILGNHELWLQNDPSLSRYFVSIDEMTSIRLGDSRITLCHYPLFEWNGSRRALDQRASRSWLIHGHIHNRRDSDIFRYIQQRMPCALNAGVDINHFEPVSFEELLANNNAWYGRKPPLSLRDTAPAFSLLSTAALAPPQDRVHWAGLLRCGGRAILFDCGEGVPSAAKEAELSLSELDLIALTRLDGDALFGLPGLLRALNDSDRTEALTVTGPEGLDAALAPILQLVGATGYAIRLLKLPPEGLLLAELGKCWPKEARLNAVQTSYSVPSLAYCFTLARPGKFMPQKAKDLGVPTKQWSLLQKGQRVQVGEITVLPEQVLGDERKGIKLLFSGRTAACAALHEAAEGASLSVCEAEREMSYEQAASAAARAGAKELWLTQETHMTESEYDRFYKALAVFPQMHCGYNGMTTALRFEV